MSRVAQRRVDIDRPLTYRPALDGFRALAITGVLATHTQPVLFQGGGIGVYLFFSLSGYLITTLLLGELRASGRVDKVRFYGRRALRLLPALFVMVAAVIAYVLITGGPGSNNVLLVALSSLLYFANWLKAAGVTLNFLGHTWSLSVEEQFYIVWPLILTLVMARTWRPRTLLVVIAVGVAGALVSRGLLVGGANAAQRIESGTDTVADQILMGCAVGVVLSSLGQSARAVLRKAAGVAVWPAAVFLLIVVFALPASSNSPFAVFWLTAGLTLIAASSATLVLYAETHPESLGMHLIGCLPLRWLGRVSYSLYLWHYAVFKVVSSAMSYSLAAVPIEVAVSLLLAAGSYYWIERPILRMRGRRLPSRFTRNTPAIPVAEVG